MTKLQIRTLTRRYLNELGVSENWQDADIDVYILAALSLMQKEVVKVDPFAFVSIATADIRAPGTPSAILDGIYNWPPGMWYELTVRKLNTTSGKYGKPLTKISILQAQEEVAESDTAYYGLDLESYGLYPVPDAALTAGLLLTYVPNLTLGVDSDVPKLHQALHIGIPVWAAILAKGETPDSVDLLGNILQSVIKDIPQFYHRGGSAEKFRPQVDKNY